MAVILSNDLSAKFFPELFALLVVCAAIIGTGAYIFLRLIASKFNNKRDDWQSAADDLGLSVTGETGLYKPFEGEADGRKFEVSHDAISVGPSAGDDYAVVETHINVRFPYSFQFKRSEMAH